ncbi:hypothetical protein KF707_06825 [Candidatus Obscuribacterales bacterium]|nr:hypothetical protein [Candidatus Obscuribacterales bacterium]
MVKPGIRQLQKDHAIGIPSVSNPLEQLERRSTLRTHHGAGGVFAGTMLPSTVDGLGPRLNVGRYKDLLRNAQKPIDNTPLPPQRTTIEEAQEQVPPKAEVPKPATPTETPKPATPTEAPKPKPNGEIEEPPPPGG